MVKAKAPDLPPVVAALLCAVLEIIRTDFHTWQVECRQREWYRRHKDAIPDAAERDAIVMWHGRRAGCAWSSFIEEKEFFCRLCASYGADLKKELPKRYLDAREEDGNGI